MFIGAGYDRAAICAALDAALVPEEGFQPALWEGLADPFPLWREAQAA